MRFTLTIADPDELAALPLLGTEPYQSPQSILGARFRRLVAQAMAHHGPAVVARMEKDRADATVRERAEAVNRRSITAASARQMRRLDNELARRRREGWVRDIDAVGGYRWVGSPKDAA